MWPFDDPRSMVTILSEIRSLLAEQNSLLREFYHARTGRQPSTQPTILSVISVKRQPPPKPTKQYTADDVRVVTREDRHKEAIKALEAQVAPWRTEDANETDAPEPPGIPVPGADNATPSLGGRVPRPIRNAPPL